jgi:hypothetical protein
VLTTLDVASNGTRAAGAVWTGARTPRDLALDFNGANTACADWTSLTGMGVRGNLNDRTRFFNDTAGPGCDQPFLIYCLAE